MSFQNLLPHRSPATWLAAFLPAHGHPSHHDRVRPRTGTHQHRAARPWGGRVAAASPTENVTDPGALSAGQWKFDGTFTASFLAAPGPVYRATDLSGPWELAFTNLTADLNGVFGLSDPNLPPEPRRFYRAHYP